MQLNEILARYAEGLTSIDQSVTDARSNPRTGEQYLPGLKSMLEKDVVRELNKWWVETHPGDFTNQFSHEVEVPFPSGGRTSCDHVITTDGNPDSAEWAIEVKYLQLVGDNGKRNDYAVAKSLSPYLKDRSLYHDILKLRSDPIARRLAVIGICFTYSIETCEEALNRHPGEYERIREIAKVCESNEGKLSPRPLIEFADGIFGIKELVKGSFIKDDFEAWAHPCGGKGIVFGWEVRRTDQVEHSSDW